MEVKTAGIRDDGPEMVCQKLTDLANLGPALLLVSPQRRGLYFDRFPVDSLVYCASWRNTTGKTYSVVRRYIPYRLVAVIEEPVSSSFVAYTCYFLKCIAENSERILVFIPDRPGDVWVLGLSHCQALWDVCNEKLQLHTKTGLALSEGPELPDEPDRDEAIIA